MKSKRSSLITKLFVALFVFAAAITVQSKTVKAAPALRVYSVDDYDVRLYAPVPSSGVKVQYEIKKLSGTLVKREIMPYITNDGSKWGSSYIPYSINQVYKMHARYYNQYTGKYGSWSSYRCILPNATTKAISSTAYRGRIKYTIKKVSGVKSYKIYVSTTSATSGYHLSKTVTPSGSSITTYLSKYVKSGRTNYIRFKPVFNNGKVGTLSNYYRYIRVY